MLQIYKTIPTELMKEYVETAVSYLKRQNESHRLKFNIDKNLNILEELISSKGFDKVLKINTNLPCEDLKKLFKHVAKKKESQTTNNNEDNESIYDSFRYIKLIDCNKRKCKNNTSGWVKLGKEYDNIAGLLADIINYLDIQVCPYCGRNYIGYLNLKKNNDSNIKSVMPCLDHYYPKSVKHEFSISLYNLIPSCNLCNLTLKKNNTRLHLNPYNEGFSDNILFNFAFKTSDEKLKYINQLTGNRKAIDKIPIILVKVKKIKVNNKILTDKEMNTYLDKCKVSNNVFHIQELYDKVHRQDAIDLVNRFVWFKENYINNLSQIVNTKKSEYLKLNKEDSSDSIIGELHRYLAESFDFIFGRWLDKENDLKQPLSKFYRDIYEQVINPNIYESLMDDDNVDKI